MRANVDQLGVLERRIAGFEQNVHRMQGAASSLQKEIEDMGCWAKRLTELETHRDAMQSALTSHVQDQESMRHLIASDLVLLASDEVKKKEDLNTHHWVRRVRSSSHEGAPPKLNPRSPPMSAREPILDAFSWHRDYDRMKVTLMSHESTKSKSPSSTASTTSLGSSSEPRALLRLGESSHVGRGELLEELRKSTMPDVATPARDAYREEVKLLCNLGLGCQRTRSKGSRIE